MPKSKGNLRFTDKELLEWHYRQAFLTYTSQLAPEVLESLKELCPKYSTVIHNYPTPSDLTNWPEDVESSGIPISCRSGILEDCLTVKGHYRTAGAPRLSEPEETAWRNAIDLRESFEAFLNRYGLTSDWLRDHYFHKLHDLALKRDASVEVSVSALAHGNDIGLQIKGWNVGESWQEFEDRARAEFENCISDHKSATIEMFKNAGYKRTFRPLDLTRVKWLVYWTVKKLDKEAILRKITKERPSKMTVEELNTVFRDEFKMKFDLPVRNARRPNSGKSPA